MIRVKLYFTSFFVLPFGLSTAPYIFVKVTRPLVKKWREEGKMMLLFLDDGFKCNSTSLMVAEVKAYLLSSGFVPKVEKTFWVPVQQLVFLGSDLNSKEGFISIPFQRISKMKQTLCFIPYCLKKHGRVPVRKEASFIGQVISMIVIGDISLIMTKFLSSDILNALSREHHIKLSTESLEQLTF